MQEAVATPIAAWGSFYVIIGSAAAVLIGLTFVAISLIPEDDPRRTRESIEAGVAVFGTSTITHLCAVLLVCGLLSAPWDDLSNAGLSLGFTGVGGMVYSLITLRRLRRKPGYQPVLEDWLFYALLPLVAYAALGIAALLLPNYPLRALFGVGAVLLALLFLSLRNTWDWVTFMTILRQRDAQD